MKTNYRADIRSRTKDREVDFLFHFTQSANLPGIVRHGLMSRRNLGGTEYSVYASDQYRLDENEDAVSVSISRVNEAMFASKRRKSGHSSWAVLVLSSEILWTYDCRFCWANAAKKQIKNHRGWRGGPWAFDEMFAGDNAVRSGLERCHPTDPEAEVQVLETIASKYIIGAIVDRPEMVGSVEATLKGLPGGPRQVLVRTF